MNAKLETISENQAVQIIKQTRNVDGKDTANYYIGSVSSVIDEYYCRPSSDKIITKNVFCLNICT